jgi:hypothetical protein
MEITLSTGPPLPKIVITELNYNPRNSQGGSAAEFVEFLNTGSLPVDMSTWSMQGISFIFPAGYILEPGNRVVIASNANPITFNIAGTSTVAATTAGANNFGNVALASGSAAPKVT